ncbi:EamA family transporter [Bacillus sp. AFS002410]|uniref:DMT family transporter n=1 Tax=Bacillus sp. AFS002410 TaxID=2033481 RepID=UPI000BEF3CC0|nr:DMT family transporter [Bacillus sp. AFS002410]PEJ56440.1 EamA family transporter [Bacillus sp. AFS002410]
MVRSYLLLLFCVICWGSNFIFGALLVKEFSPILLSALRLCFILLFIAFYALVKKKWKMVQKKDLFMIILLGLIGTCINQWSFYSALETTHPTTSALILALAPLTTSFLASIFLKERLTKGFVIGSIIAFIGVFFVITNGQKLEITIGLIWIFLTMLTFSISIIMIKKLTESYDSTTITLYSNLIGFGGLLPIVLFSGTTHTMSNQAVPWILLIVTAIIMHGICTLIWNHQIQIVGASKAAMFLNLEPFIAMLVGLIVLKNNITGSQFLGGALIIIGVFLSTSLKWKRAIKEPSYIKETKNF